MLMVCVILFQSHTVLMSYFRYVYQGCEAIVLNDDMNKPMWTEMSDQRQECLSIKFNKEVQIIVLMRKLGIPIEGYANHP